MAGCYLKREGGAYSLWINPKTGVTETVPRHSEIKEPLNHVRIENRNFGEKQKTRLDLQTIFPQNVIPAFAGMTGRESLTKQTSEFQCESGLAKRILKNLNAE